MSRIDKKIIDKLVFDLERPARYVGGEYNHIFKEYPYIRMAICYPDLYEIGMSNNGIRILYDISNGIEDVACERVFAVPGDFERKIREMALPLYTLETYTPLCDLDLIGFNIAHELLYTNILQVLELGDIPIFSRDRNEEHPIVIAGGGAVSNPLPMSDFIDVFFIGDGEEGIIDILNVIRTSKYDKIKREHVIDKLSEIEEIYTPSKYRFKHNEELSGIEGRNVKKRIYRGFEAAVPERPIVPNIRITQERSVVEVTRGCKGLCKYCHAGYYELPYRLNKPDVLGERILKIIKNTGYSDLTLSSLSISDYRYLVRLLNIIMPELTERGISISLPSLRVDQATLPIIEAISDIRKTSLTFAVESACDAIRNLANKRLKTDDLLFIIKYIFERGWRGVKLYFMIGLPGCEEYDEAGEIIRLLKEIHGICKKKIKINVTISPFVPKPHTPFQWEQQMDIDYFEDKIRTIKRALPMSIKIKNHDARASILEGVFSRGDILLGKVIYSSFRDGCRLDSWKEHFNFDIWTKNLDEFAPHWRRYLSSRDDNEILPWSFITTGYEKLIEFQKRKASIRQKTRFVDHKLNEEPGFDALTGSLNKFKSKYNVNKRIRVRFSKKETARYISHIDFIEIIKRALRMMDVPVSFTQGYNKREKISMGYPLPLGIESVSELCDVELYSDISLEATANEINSKLPGGVEVIDVRYLDNKESIMSSTIAAQFLVEFMDEDLFRNCVRGLESRNDLIKEGKKAARKIEFKDAVIDYIIEKNRPGSSSIPGRAIKIKVSVGSENSMRIDKIMLSLSEAKYEEFYKFNVMKLCQYRNGKSGLEEIW